MSNAIRTKPFPWKCRKCGETAIQPATVTYSVDVEHDGRTYPITVYGLISPQCEACKTIFPDAEANRQITNEFRRQAGLLFPKQIKDWREHLGLTQQEFADLLGVAQTTICRWETGAQIQQRSLDNWMRAFFAFPDVRTALIIRVLPSIGFVGAACSTNTTVRSNIEFHGGDEKSGRISDWGAATTGSRVVIHGSTKIAKLLGADD